MVALAGRLFGGVVPESTCDDSPAGAASDRALQDINGDGEPNISDVVSLAAFLFNGGAEPALGTECIGFPSCDTICEP